MAKQTTTPGVARPSAEHDYSPPRVMVLGRLSDLTRGPTTGGPEDGMSGSFQVSVVTP